MNRSGAVGLGLALLLAAGCAEPSYPTAPTPRAATPTPLPETPQQLPILPMPGASAPPARSQSVRPARDACGAYELQSLIGQPRSQIPVPLDPSRHRVACTTCPAAQDVDPGRITFLFDARSGRIQQIRCG